MRGWEVVMNHRDAELTDVIVVLEALDTTSTLLCVERLKTVGLEISKVDDEQSIVEGCILSSKVYDLRSIECVRYVRNVFSYTADYPAGDPRDLDGPETD